MQVESPNNSASNSFFGGIIVVRTCFQFMHQAGTSRTNVISDGAPKRFGGPQ
jgi:hypothetical protein